MITFYKDGGSTTAISPALEDQDYGWQVAMFRILPTVIYGSGTNTTYIGASANYMSVITNIDTDESMVLRNGDTYTWLDNTNTATTTTWATAFTVTAASPDPLSTTITVGINLPTDMCVPGFYRVDMYYKNRDSGYSNTTWAKIGEVMYEVKRNRGQVESKYSAVSY